MDNRHTNGPAPARTDEQRREALKRANRIRTVRGELKRRIKYDPTYRLLAAAIYNDTDELGLEAGILDTMKVYELLIAGAKLGRVKVNAALTRARTSPSKSVGGLTERQREELVVELGLMRRSMEHQRANNRNYRGLDRAREALSR